MAPRSRSDLTHKISKAYGVLIDSESDPDSGIAMRGSFVIDPRGVCCCRRLCGRVP